MHKALKNCLLIGIVFFSLSASFVVLAQTTTSSAEKLKEGSSAASPQFSSPPPVPSKEQIKDLTGAAGLTNTNQNSSAISDPFSRLEQSEKKNSVLEKSIQTLTNIVFGIIFILVMLSGAVIFLFIETYRKK